MREYIKKFESAESVSLDSALTYSEQGYSIHYSQNTYDSSIGTLPEHYFVGNNYPYEGDIIYSYCNDIVETT